jgi:hypothetical protein
MKVFENWEKNYFKHCDGKIKVEKLNENFVVFEFKI